MAVKSSARSRQLSEFGDHLRTWRKASRLTAQIVSERAGITRDTLRALETGSGSVKLENVFAVLAALGLTPAVLAAVDPTRDERGRALLLRGLPERVRT